MLVAQIAFTILKFDLPSLLNIRQIKVLRLLKVLILQMISENGFIMRKQPFDYQRSLQNRIILLILNVFDISNVLSHFPFNVFNNEFVHVGSLLL